MISDSHIHVYTNASIKLLVRFCLVCTHLLKEPTSAEPSRKAVSAVLPLSSRLRCTSGRLSMLSLLDAAPCVQTVVEQSLR